jgi:hypothetical protein
MEADAAIVPHNLVARYVNLEVVHTSEEFPHATISASRDVPLEVQQAISSRPWSSCTKTTNISRPCMNSTSKASCRRRRGVSWPGALAGTDLQLLLIAISWSESGTQTAGPVQRCATM